MITEINHTGENAIPRKSWDGLFYFMGAVALCSIISMATFYWHAGIVKDGLSYIYADKKKFPGLELHEFVAMLFLWLWGLSLFSIFPLIPLSLLYKRKVSWKALLFSIASQASVFCYFKFSSFLDWYID